MINQGQYYDPEDQTHRCYSSQPVQKGKVYWDPHLGEYFAIALDGHEVFGNSFSQTSRTLAEVNAAYIAHCRKSGGD